MFEALLKITGEESVDNFQMVMKDGDIELGVVPASVGEWRVVAVSTAEDEPECICDLEANSLKLAIDIVRDYLRDEYAEVNPRRSLPPACADTRRLIAISRCANVIKSTMTDRKREHMKTITEAEFTAAIESELTEVFELVAGQKAYLEVLRGEDDRYVGTLRSFNVGEFYNASALFAHDGEYAFVKAEKSGDIIVSHFAYESLGDAKRHAMQLLATSLNDYEPEESDLSRVSRFETINDMLSDGDKSALKVTYDAAEIHSEEILSNGDEKLYEDIHGGNFVIDCICEPRLYAN